MSFSLSAWLGSWILLSKPKQQDRRTENVGGFIVDLLLAVVFGVVPMPVIVKWIGWMACWGGALYVLSVLTPLYRLPFKTRIVIGLTMTLALGTWLFGTAKGQWIEERAASPDGYIHSKTVGSEPFSLMFGQYGGLIPWPATESIRMFPDSEFRIDKGVDGIEISTTVHDKNGNVVVAIDRNHWHVTSACLDKNFTDNALEVKDLRGRIVLQVILLPTIAQVQGEWRNSTGWAIRWSNDDFGKVSNSNLDLWKTPEQERKVEALHLIDPMFHYPSREHLGELVR